MSILTLSTDIGWNDYIVGAIKGQLVSAVEDLNILDITHSLSASNYPQSAYICGNAIKHYPKNSIHIILLNLFDSQPDHFLMARYNDQIIICPDNGILTMIAHCIPKELVTIKITTSKSLTTLNYTEAIAKVVASLYVGNKFEDIGVRPEGIVEKYSLRPTLGSNWLEGQIIFIDHNENVVVNITKEEFEEHRGSRNFQIIFTRETIQNISDNYASVGVGEKFAWFNSAGYLEIAINKGNVAGLFGLQGISDIGSSSNAQQNNWFYKSVRIFFFPVEESAPILKPLPKTEMQK